MPMLLVLLAGAGCTPAGPRALLEGKRRIEQGRFREAIESLQKATSLMSTNAQAWNYLGLAYHYAAQPAEAQKAYEQALALNRDLTEVHYNLGCLLLEQNKTNSARNELTTFNLRRADSLEGLLKLGLAQLRARDWSGAEKSYSDALRLNPKKPEALNGLALARVQRGRSAEAVPLLITALKIQPDYKPALLNLAIVQQQFTKDKSAALRAYQAYLAVKPASADVEAVKAVAHQLEQEMAQSSRPVSQVVQVPVTNTTAKPTLPEPARVAVAPLAKSEPVVEQKAAPPVAEPAVEYEVVRLNADPVIKTAEDVPPAPRDSLADPAQLASTNSEQKPKRGLLQKVNPLNLFHNDSKPSTNSSLPLAAETVEMPSEFPRYTYGSPAKPAAGKRSAAQPWFEHGVQAQQGHRVAEAIQSYKRAIELDPAFFEAQYNLGLVNAETGNTNAAFAAYETALAIRPESADARYNFALLLKQAGFIGDAINQFNRILAARPDDARCHLALGNLYAQQLHEPAKARLHYLKLLESDPHHPQAGAIHFWLSSNP